MTKKKTTKKTAKKRGKKTTKAANDGPLPLPPMPGVQEHIPETLSELIPEVHEQGKALDEAKKACAAWGREIKTRDQRLTDTLDRLEIEDDYFDGQVRVRRTVKDPKRKIEVEVLNETEAAE